MLFGGAGNHNGRRLFPLLLRYVNTHFGVRHLIGMVFGIARRRRQVRA